LKNTKKCVICGKEFFCSPSRNVVTCSKECRLKHISNTHKGMKMTSEARAKIASARKNLETASEIQRKATEAAKKSPKSGRFITNRAAIDWHLVSPDGHHFYIHSLAFWLRENCKEYFGVEPDSRGYLNAIYGLSRVKKSVLGTLPAGQRPGYTYKGWSVIPTEQDKANARSIYKVQRGGTGD
jgi:hypothetical protein